MSPASGASGAAGARSGTRRRFVGRKRRRRRRWLVPVWILVVVVIGVATNAWLALRREALQERVTAALRDALACPFELGSVEIGVTSGARIRSLRLHGPDGSDPIVEVGEVRLVPRVSSLLAGSFELALVALEDVRLEVGRDESGRWNLDGLLRPRPPQEDEGGPLKLPDVVVRRCSLRFVDRVAGIDEEIRDLEFTFSSAADGGFAFTGEVRQELAGTLRLSGRCELEPDNARLDARIRAWKVDVGRVLERLVPKEHGAALSAWSPSGTLDVDAEIRVDGRDGVRVRRIGGRLIRGRVQPPGVDLPIEELSAGFLVRERTIELSELTGLVAAGRLTGSGALEFAPEDLSLRSWSLSADLESVPVDRALSALLDPEGPLAEDARELVRSLALGGTFGGSIEVRDATSVPPDLDRVAGTLRLHGVRIGHERLPAPVEQLRGELALDSGKVLVKAPLEAVCAGARLTVPEGIVSLSSRGPVDVTLKVGDERPGSGLRLDERARRIVPSNFWWLYDSFRAEGEATAAFRVHRPAAVGDEPAALAFQLRAQPLGIRIAHSGFPYDVRDITGEVRYDSQLARVTLVDLKGRHGDTVVTGEGAIQIGHPTMFRIDVRCEDLESTPAVIAALDEPSRQLIADFGFHGRTKTHVRIFTRSDGHVDVVTELDLIDASVRPRRFPYPLRIAGGKILLLSGRAIEVRGLRTADDARPRVVFDGSITMKEGVQRIEYAFDIESLAVDEVFLDALPLGLDEFVRGFGLQGSYHGKLGGWYVSDAADPDATRAFYEGRDIRTDDAAVDFGIRVRDMKATGRFVGGHTRERPNHFWGEVWVESGWFNRLHLTKGEVAFQFGEPHAHVLADRAGQSVPGREYRIPDEFLRRLHEDRVADTFQMSVRSSDVYGGKVDGILFVDTGDLGDIGGHFEASGLQLQRAARDIFGVEGRDVRGVAEGNVRFQGKTGDIRSIVGEGLGVIREARLVELPLFLQVLNVLRLDFRQASERNFFSEVSLPYAIREGKFHAQDLRIKSPAVTLVGNGTLDFSGALDLELQPQVVDAEIPLWDQLVGLLKDALARVRVRGDLAEPKVEFVTAAGLITIPVDTEVESEPSRPLPRDLDAPDSNEGSEPR